MKTGRAFLLLALLALPWSGACTSKSAQTPTAHAICGHWEWVANDKGFFGLEHGNPDASWITSSIRFAPDGKYEQFQDGKLIAAGRYTVEREDTIFGNQEVVRVTTDAGTKWRRVVMDLTAHALSLAEDCRDCDGAAFTRVQE